jgi:hypothetical protein
MPHPETSQRKNTVVKKSRIAFMLRAWGNVQDQPSEANRVIMLNRRGRWFKYKLRNDDFWKKWSGRADLNGRPPAPKAGALTRLRYAPTLFRIWCLELGN